MNKLTFSDDDEFVELLVRFCACRVYNIGIEVRQGRGRYSDTNIITFTPRYQLDNQSSHKLAYTQLYLVKNQVGIIAESNLLLFQQLHNTDNKTAIELWMEWLQERADLTSGVPAPGVRMRTRDRA